MKKMNILMVTPECYPYAKTGGLADVLGALPKALKKLGHDVRVVMPKYSSIDSSKHNIKPFLSPLGVWMGMNEEWCSVHEAEMEGEVPVYFIEHNLFFNREGFYHDNELNDYYDNPKRFGFLSRAALQLCKDIEFKVDIIHAHDWQASLSLAYQKIWHWDDPIIGNAANVLTIHNIGYQGKYGAEHYSYLGLQWDNFVPERFEDFGSINFLKGGIKYADVVTTVSPTYANETKTKGFSYGLHVPLIDKRENYVGILNGVDYEHWDPKNDEYIPKKYNLRSQKGKKECKKQLQKRFGLTVDDNIPLIGVVSRFAHQKGLDVLANTLERITKNMVVQFVILGSGDQNLVDQFNYISSISGSKIGIYVGYNNELAHWIEAGSDFFIMPSMYEPCGLNQIYSLKYGTLPIVRATGGLEDTVEQYDELTGEGTGFKFYDLSEDAIYYTVGWAISTYFDRPAHIKKMIKAGMRKNFSWKESAKKYEKVYLKALKDKK